MEKELYIFSNDPTPPVKEFKEGLNSDYTDLSVYLNPEIASAPSYSGTPKHNVSELDRYKSEYPEYKFVHVYKLAGHEEATGDYALPSGANAVDYYKYSHKEFNLRGQRKKA